MTNSSAPGAWAIASVDDVPADSVGPAVSAPVAARIAGLRREADRRAHLAARALAIACVSRVTGIAAHELRLQQHCEGCGASDHGRPSVVGHPEVSVTWSHTDSTVAAAADLFAVAVDVEDRAHVARDLAPDILSAAELAWYRQQHDEAEAFLRLWCRKECAVKLGLANLDTLPLVDFASDGRLAERWAGHHIDEVSSPRAVAVALSVRPLQRLDVGMPHGSAAFSDGARTSTSK